MLTVNIVLNDATIIPVMLKVLLKNKKKEGTAIWIDACGPPQPHFYIKIKFKSKQINVSFPKEIAPLFFKWIS